MSNYIKCVKEKIEKIDYLDELEDLLDNIGENEIAEKLRRDYHNIEQEFDVLEFKERKRVQEYKKHFIKILESYDYDIEGTFKELLEQVEFMYNQEMARLIETIKNGNKNSKNIQEFIEELFLANELKSFLNYEKENFNNNLETKLNREDYKILTNYKNLTDDFIGIYYNSELGTSFEDISLILRNLVEEWKESNEEVKE